MMSVRCKYCGREFKNTWGRLQHQRQIHTNVPTQEVKPEDTPWYGKPTPEEVKRKLSEAEKGKVVSEETRRKMSKAAKKRFKDPEERKKFEGKNNPMYGNSRSEEAKKKISEAAKKRLEDPTDHPFYGEKHTIETKKKISETQKERFEDSTNHPWYGKTGKQNPAWKGGKSFEPYPPEFNERLKEKIRERDDQTCQMCGMSEEESKKKYGRKLMVHHIDGNKDNCDESNLVAVCCKCNSKIEGMEERPQFEVAA